MEQDTPTNPDGSRPWVCAGCGKPSEGRERVCDCATACLFRYGGKMEHEVKTEPPSETVTDADIQYLGQAEAHADEGPLGEAAARSILKIALRLAAERADITSSNRSTK